jgi:hypothetical protein
MKPRLAATPIATRAVDRTRPSCDALMLLCDGDPSSTISDDTQGSDQVSGVK